MDLYNLVFSKSGVTKSDLAAAAGNWYRYDPLGNGFICLDYLIQDFSITDWAAATSLPSFITPSLTLGFDLYAITDQNQWDRESVLSLRPRLIEIYNLLKEHELLAIDGLIYTVRPHIAVQPININFTKQGNTYRFVQEESDRYLEATWKEGAADLSTFSIGYSHYPYADDVTLSTDQKTAIQSKLGIVPAPTKHIYTRDTGTLTVTLEDNAEYEFNGCYDVHLVFPSTPFKSHIRFNFGTTVNVVFPADAHYIGSEPQFEEMTAWEVSIKDGVIVAGKIDW